jgi:hypothetical protein
MDCRAWAKQGPRPHEEDDMSKPSQREKLRDAEGSGAFFVAVSAVEAYASVVGFAPEDAVAIIHDYFTS